VLDAFASFFSRFSSAVWQLSRWHKKSNEKRAKEKAASALAEVT